MNKDTIFESFNQGRLLLSTSEKLFGSVEWSKHPTFDGVEIKNIITAKDTNGRFSYHLVRIAPNKSIKSHIHEKQLETHEVISGAGFSVNDGVKLEYLPGTISIIEANVSHEVNAGENGLFLFAKFLPALS